jgi:uncharacterized membrane protein (UPF0127 family)
MSASESRPSGPRTLSVLSAARGTTVCERCEIADLPLGRLRGLLGRRGLEPGAGLLLEPSNSIHTFFMLFPIDVVFLDSELRVLRTRTHLGPWRVAGVKRARAVLELPAGEVDRRGIEVGEQLHLTPTIPIAMTAAARAVTVSKEA